MTLNLWSVGEFTLEAKGLALAADSLELLPILADLSSEPLMFSVKVIVSAKSYSRFALRVARPSTLYCTCWICTGR